jgi:hypothetical protein
MTDTILTHDMIAERALFDLSNQLTFAKNVYTGYSKEFHGVGGYKKSNSVRVQKPNKYVVQDGATISLVDTYERETTVTVDLHKHVALDFTAVQLKTDIESFSKKYIKPATEALANYVDYTGCAEVTNLYNMVGTGGTTPASFGVLADAAERLDNEAVPRDSRVAIFSPRGHWKMADGELKALFSQQLVETMIRKGFIGRFALADMYMDQNMQSYTTGSGVSKCDGETVQVKTQPAEEATSIALKNFAENETLLAGDVITFSTVAGVNPMSRAAWENNQLRQFVVTATATADASGDMTVNLSPAIISSAATSKALPYQTVNDLPAVNDYVTAHIQTNSTAYMQNAMFHPNTFCLTMLPFDPPQSAGQSVKWATATDEQLGLSITFASGFDISNYKEIYRLDILFGWDTIYPDLGCRITG